MPAPAPLMDRLRELMPPRPDPPSDSLPMLRFDPQPIRSAAEAFSYAIDFTLPANRDELLALLWCFGEILDGEMARRQAATMRLVDEVMATRLTPTSTLTLLTLLDGEHKS